MSYLNIPTSDGHIHVFWNMLLEQKEKLLQELMENFSYDTVTILTIPYNSTRLTKCRDFTENLTAFYLKSKMPGKVYAFAGLNHHYEEEKNTPEFYVEQAEFYMAAGFDGIKMIEGRPRQRHITGDFSDPKYDLLYKYCEEKQIPMVIHSNAPDVCWNNGGNPARTLDKNGNITSWREYHNEIIGILEKYPKLRLTIAHFEFASQHEKEAAEFFERFENVYLDVCPNQFMFMDFGEKPEVWKPFFEKYQDRLIYGTDIGSNTKDLDGSEAKALVHMVKGFFEEDEPYSELGYSFKPIKTDEKILRKIYKENLMNFYQHKEPKKVNPEVMRKEWDIVMTKYFTFLDLRDIQTLKTIETVL